MRRITGTLLAVAIVIFAMPGRAAPPDTLAITIARALSYFDGTEKRYSISDEWRALSGETVVCVRSDIPNGTGGWAPTSDFSMFFLANETITNMVKDNSTFGCTNRQYEALRPISKTMKR